MHSGLVGEQGGGERHAQGGGWGQPPGGYGPPGGGPGAPGGYGPPGGGGYGPPGGGGFAPPAGGPPGGPKPITGGKQTIAMHQMSIDPNTGLPRGEKPPASTASVVALICGLLLCLGPLTGIPAIIAGFMGLSAAKKDPTGTGGRGMAIAGIVLGAINLLGSLAYIAFLLIVAISA